MSATTSPIQSEPVMDRSWFIFRVRTNKETRAASYVSDAGYTVALPRVIHRVRASRHTQRRVDKAFVGLKSYLLVGFEDDQIPREHFWKVSRLPYVSDPVGLGCYAARVKSEEVRTFLNHGAWDRRSVEKLIRNWEPNYCKGDIVALRGIASGAVRGTVCSINLKAKMADIEIELLGKPSKIKWPADDCVYIETPKTSDEKKTVGA